MTASHSAIAINASILSQLAPPSPTAWIWPWAVSVFILVVGLVLYGWSDLIRFHWRRVWAISGVCVTESLRRRVLWLTPAAMLGIVVVSQFQVSADPQEAIQQTTKFCLFASALIVSVTAIILASTNLPREIESRVIFTIVTKPTTRLEIVLGKVVGYARVSGLIILIMGAFTLAYLQLRARPMIAELRQKAAAMPANSPLRATTDYYINSGLLGTRSMEWAKTVQVFSQPPTGDKRWLLGGVGQFALLPFNLGDDERSLFRQAADKGVGVSLALDLDVRRHQPSERERQEAHDMKLEEGQRSGAATRPDYNLPAPTTAPAAPTQLVPQVLARFCNDREAPLIRMNQYDPGDEVTMKGADAGGEAASGSLHLSADMLHAIADAGRIYVQISPRTPATEFGFAANPARLVFDLPNSPQIAMAPPAPANAPGAMTTIYSAYATREGVRLTSVKPWSSGPVAVFRFSNVNVTPNREGKVGLQVAVSIERTGETKEDMERAVGFATSSLEVVNLKTGESSGQIIFSPETSRTEPVSVDGRYVAGGEFNVMLRDTMEGAALGMETGQNGSVALVAADRNFVLNLVKSLLILWLLTVLVVIVSIFCSTFVSWPIAVVLTVVILLSHWGVDQLGGALDKGSAGRSAVTGFGIQNPASSEVVATTVDYLSTGLKYLSIVLPDVEDFPVMEDIERGVSIPPEKVLGALRVIFCFGLPMLVFSYVVLRRKEVAP